MLKILNNDIIRHIISYIKPQDILNIFNVMMRCHDCEILDILFYYLKFHNGYIGPNPTIKDLMESCISHPHIPISSFPYVINKSGSYKVIKDLNFDLSEGYVRTLI